MQIHLRPRLQAAADLLSDRDTVADIGCDHGRLSCSLLQQNACKRCIATDISEASVQKTIALSAHVGVTDRIDVRLGDGFLPLHIGEADAVALFGMGGTLMTRLLDACQTPLQGASIAVFQPMRAYADIRKYLYQNHYEIIADEIALDSGRLYQIIAAVPPTPRAQLQKLPEGWPEDCFDVGFLSYEREDPLLAMLAAYMLRQHEKRLATAQGKPSAALLEKKAADMKKILRLIGGNGC